MSEKAERCQKYTTHPESNACMFGVRTPGGRPPPYAGGNTSPAMEMRMAVEQLTYIQLGERLGISPEAARQKALRGRWRRIPGNDGKTLVEVDLASVAPPMSLSEASATKRKPSKPRAVRDPYEQGTDAQTIQALNGHLNTLREQLEKAELSAAESRKEVALERERVAELTAQIIKLSGQIAALQERRSFWNRMFGGDK